MEEKIRQILRGHYGNFETLLEVEYENKMVQILLHENEEVREQWMTYNQVIYELKFNVKNELKLKEFQYRLTEKVMNNMECGNVIRDIKDLSPELQRLYEKVMIF